VIVIDFIDMESRRDQLQVLEHFNKALRADKARPQIAQLSELGLVELTRKRQGKNIYEIFGRPCTTCGGLGHLVHLPGESAEEGEIVERPAAGGRESRGYDRGGRGGRGRSEVVLPDAATPAPAPPELFWEDRSEDADDGNDMQELGLSHPNYQDLSGSNRRRRRRRVGEETRPAGAIAFGGVPNRFDPGSDTDASAPSEDAPLSRRGERPERSERPERGGRGRGGRGRGGRDSATNEFNTIRETVATVETPPELGFPREGVVQDSPFPEERRGRSRRESTKPQAEPPELIAVEMTPEEQEVYAWMGISPLVLSTKTVKNPKSAIISVVLPGEAPPVDLIAPPVDPIATPAIAEPETTAFATADTEPGAPVLVSGRSPIRSRKIIDTNPVAVVAPPEVVSVSPPEQADEGASEPEHNASEPEPSDTENGGVVRRRRRRSSASTAE